MPSFDSPFRDGTIGDGLTGICPTAEQVGQCTDARGPTGAPSLSLHSPPVLALEGMEAPLRGREGKDQGKGDSAPPRPPPALLSCPLIRQLVPSLSMR